MALFKVISFGKNPFWQKPKKPFKNRLSDKEADTKGTKNSITTATLVSLYVKRKAG